MIDQQILPKDEFISKMAVSAASALVPNPGGRSPHIGPGRIDKKGSQSPLNAI
ncbi:hypothetical protein [Thalassococcus sp. BH17M4-6]|uniref:hypothetical protein n=1 Tax=Thalassococcus sp. BH17M4-6 TaxID=3413148 RepID=UPI003BF4763A